MEEAARRAIESESFGGHDWIEQELAASKLPDLRLEKRLRHVAEQLANGVGRSIPWAATLHETREDTVTLVPL